MSDQVTVHQFVPGQSVPTTQTIPSTTLSQTFHTGQFIPGQFPNLSQIVPVKIRTQATSYLFVPTGKI
jgi:hypothetical protein